MDTIPLLKHVEYLVSQDETELALKCLDMIPGYYRDHKHPEIEACKKQILSKILTVYDLLDDNRDYPKSDEYAKQFTTHTARGATLFKEVQEANKNNINPHIIDIGPGDYCFPIHLHNEGLRFTYESHTLNKKSKDLFMQRAPAIIGQTPDIYNIFFVAYEYIEHLPDITLIRQMHDRILTRPKKIFLSTPKYTFGDGTKNWKTEGIHHLRTYTPREFIQESVKLFPDRKLNYIDDPVMVIVGE